MPVQKQILYTGVKGLLEAVQVNDQQGRVMRFSVVELWRNNLVREPEDQPFKRRAAFIEFLPSNYMELSNGLQSYDMTMRVHLIFESYKDEDTDVWILADAAYRALQGKQFGYFGKIKRREEIEDFDHDNVQDYTIDFDCGKAIEYPSAPTTVEIEGIEITPDITVITE